MTDKTRPADLVQAIECAGPGFTPELAKIARFTLDHPEPFIRKTSEEICAEPRPRNRPGREAGAAFARGNP